jgi:TolB protein
MEFRRLVGLDDDRLRGRRGRRPRALALIALPGLIALMSAGCGKPPTAADERGASAAADVCGQLVFASSEGGHDHPHEHVVSLPARGGEPTTLSASALSRYPAAVAPDGRRLLILESEPLPTGKTRDGFWLLELSPDGAAVGEPRAIGPRDTALRNPAWSPDGAWIVFESDAESFRDLYRLELDRDAPVRLTNNPEGNFEPSVSPDGRQIAFASSRDGDAEIYVMSADGGDPRRLTTSVGDDTGPVWSPDGRTLAFASGRERARGHDVHVLDLATLRVDPLVRDGSRSEAVFVRDLAFAPTGDRLAFTELVPKRGHASIAVVELASGRVLARTNGPGVDEQASWSPDGRHFVFARSHAGQSDIVRATRDGDSLEQLTRGGVFWLPRWLALDCPPSAGG